MIRKKETRHVKGIVDGLIRKWESGPLKKGNAVMSAWSEAVGSDRRRHARPVSLKKGTLVVIVENSAWLYRLTMEKRTILERFNKSYRGRARAEDIRFRIGDLSE